MRAGGAILSASRRALIGSLAFGMLSLIGCKAVLEVGPSAGQACLSNADCPAQETCLPASTATTNNASSGGGVCVIGTESPGTASAEEVFLQITPSDGVTPSMQFGPMKLSNGQAQSIVLPPPVEIQGVVTTQGSPTGVVSATLNLIAESGIPNNPLVINTQTASDGSFDVVIPRGVYSVTVIPPASSAPQPPPQGFPALDTDTAAMPLTYQLSNPNVLVELSGTVSLASGRPAAGIQVSVTNDSAAYQVPGAIPQVLAQPATTDANGNFELWLPPVGSIPVELQFGPAPNGAPFPSINVGPVQVSATTNLMAQVSQLDVGAAVPVSGTVTGPSGPAAGALVVLQTQPAADGTPPPFTFTATATTDAQGQFSATVYGAGTGPVLYSIVAQPADATDPTGTLDLCRLPTTVSAPDGGTGAVAADTVAMTSGTSVQVALTCGARLAVADWVIAVTSAGNVHVPNVSVLAVRQPSVDFPSALTLQTVTDSNGHFVMSLEAGNYIFKLQPPVSSGFPYTNVPVELDATNASTIGVFVLDAPFDLFGQIFVGNTATPLAATIDAYASAGSATSVATLIGQGVSLSTGSYSILLPESDL